MNVSVVLPTCNEAALIDETLAALFGQTTTPTEILIVDSSTDATQKIITAWQERFARKKCQLRLLTLPAANGIAAARQLGFQSATSPLIASLDGDCRPSENWVEQIEAQWQRLLENEKYLSQDDSKRTVALVGSIYLADGPWLARLSTKLGWYRLYFHLNRSFFGFSPLYGSNSVVSKISFETAGGFNTAHNNINTLDDAEIGARLSRIGAVRFAPSLIVKSRWRWFNRPHRDLNVLLIRVQSLHRIARAYKQAVRVE